MHRYIGRLFLAAIIAAPLAAMPAAARAGAEPGCAIIISEVAWAGSSANASDEWIELTNLGVEPVGLGGWTLDGAATSHAALTLPDGLAVGPLESFLIANYADANASSALARTPDLVTTALSLPNESFAVSLRDSSGNPCDTAGDGTTPPAGRTGSDGGGAGGGVGGGTASMVRAAPVKDGALDASWTTATESAGFDDGFSDLGTPGSAEGWFFAEADDAPGSAEAEKTEETADDETSGVSAQEDGSETPGDVVTDENAEETNGATESADTSKEAAETETKIEPKAGTETDQEEPTVTDAANLESDVSPPEEQPEETPDSDSTDVPASIASFPAGTLVVNELASDADEEWIEILNPYNNVIPLSGWAVRDASGKETALPDQLLGWEQTVVVRDPAGKLNNDGDRVELVASTGAIIDSVEYGVGPIQAPRRPNVLARAQDGTWHLTPTPTPGAKNVIPEPEPNPESDPTTKEANAHGNEGTSSSRKSVMKADGARTETPETASWIGVTTLRLSELYPNTTGNDLTEEFIEIENFGNESTDLSGWSIADASGHTFRAAVSLAIDPGERITLVRAETRIALNNTGDSVSLIAPNGSVIDTCSYASTTKGSSLVRSGTEWVWTRTPTPDEQNVLSSDETGSGPTRTPESKQPAASVAPASAGSVAATVRVSGTVLVVPGVLGKQIFYVLTEAGGWQIYKYDASFPELSVGDSVVAGGTVTENRGERRLKVANGGSIVVLARGEPPVPEDRDIAELTTGDHGKLVRVRGTVLARSGSTATIEDQGSRLAVRVADGTGIEPSAIASGASVTVTGILVATQSGMTLLPRDKGDLSFETDDSTSAAVAGVDAPDAEAQGKRSHESQDRAVALLIGAGVSAGLLWLALRKPIDLLLRRYRRYEKANALRPATQTTD